MGIDFYPPKSTTRSIPLPNYFVDKQTQRMGELKPDSSLRVEVTHLQYHAPKGDPPPFDGNDPRRWLRRLTPYFRIVNPSSSQEWLDFATLKFTGKAKKWFQGYKSKINSWSWMDFVTSLLKEFDNTKLRQENERHTKGAGHIRFNEKKVHAAKSMSLDVPKLKDVVEVKGGADYSIGTKELVVYENESENYVDKVKFSLMGATQDLPILVKFIKDDSESICAQPRYIFQQLQFPVREYETCPNLDILVEEDSSLEKNILYGEREVSYTYLVVQYIRGIDNSKMTKYMVMKPPKRADDSVGDMSYDSNAEKISKLSQNLVNIEGTQKFAETHAYVDNSSCDLDKKKVTKYCKKFSYICCGKGHIENYQRASMTGDCKMSYTKRKRYCNEFCSYMLVESGLNYYRTMGLYVIANILVKSLMDAKVVETHHLIYTKESNQDKHLTVQMEDIYLFNLLIWKWKKLVVNQRKRKKFHLDVFDSRGPNQLTWLLDNIKEREEYLNIESLYFYNINYLLILSVIAYYKMKEYDSMNLTFHLDFDGKLKPHHQSFPYQKKSLSKIGNNRARFKILVPCGAIRFLVGDLTAVGHGIVISMSEKLNWKNFNGTILDVEEKKRSKMTLFKYSEFSSHSMLSEVGLSINSEDYALVLHEIHVAYSIPYVSNLKGMMMGIRERVQIWDLWTPLLFFLLHGIITIG